MSGGWALNMGNNFVGIDNTWHRVLLVANRGQVPEPSTVMLLGIAIAGHAAARSRRKANA